MNIAIAWIVKNWRITAVAALIAALAFMYWRLDSMAARLDLANQKASALQVAVDNQAKDIKNTNSAIAARAKEASEMQGQLFNISKNLNEVMKNDEIAKAWSNDALPDSILEWMREQPVKPSN